MEILQIIQINSKIYKKSQVPPIFLIKKNIILIFLYFYPIKIRGYEN